MTCRWGAGQAADIEVSAADTPHGDPDTLRRTQLVCSSGSSVPRAFQSRRCRRPLIWGPAPRPPSRTPWERRPRPVGGRAPRRKPFIKRDEYTLVILIGAATPRASPPLCATLSLGHRRAAAAADEDGGGGPAPPPPPAASCKAWRAWVPRDAHILIWILAGWTAAARHGPCRPACPVTDSLLLLLVVTS